MILYKKINKLMIGERKVNSSRSNTIDISKGLAIFLVVLGHVIQYTFMARGEDFFENPVFEVIYSFHMPLFMFISGYLAYGSIKRRSLTKNLQSKIKTLLIPYVVWTVILTIANMLLVFLSKREFNFIEFGRMLIHNLFLNPSIWFLYVLFIFYIMLYMTVFLQKNSTNWAFFVIPILIFFIPFETTFGTHYIQFFYPFFLIGYLISKYRLSNFLTSKNKYKVVFFLSLLVIYLLLIICWEKSDYIYINLMELNVNSGILIGLGDVIYRYTIAFTGIAIVMLFSSWVTNPKSVSFLESVGRSTLQVYLIQTLTVSFLYRYLVDIIGFPLATNSWIFIVYSILFTIINIILCIWIAKKVIGKNDKLHVLLFGFANRS